jgi:hypothetical protein
MSGYKPNLENCIKVLKVFGRGEKLLYPQISVRVHAPDRLLGLLPLWRIVNYLIGKGYLEENGDHYKMTEQSLNFLNNSNKPKD